MFFGLLLRILLESDAVSYCFRLFIKLVIVDSERIGGFSAQENDNNKKNNMIYVMYLDRVFIIGYDYDVIKFSIDIFIRYWHIVFHTHFIDFE